ncbi:MAG: SDR family NAD(P)-dependent oxidoreductase, partial [Pseudomonadota bacterium]
MDLGISGRKAIVCASSEGLGKGCALALAEAGCEVIVNARTQATVESTAQEIAAATGAHVVAVAADVGTPEGRAAILEACPDPDILVNNNGGPPRKDFITSVTDGANGTVEIVDGQVVYTPAD